ncbi:hypothetical protein BCR43DRAFT_264920 [Syncephalastrum racemosum]|uniref:Uncharacterized protein n=1 Tax=Syncephalastrum racemosum TaxID=13706 RepID=A0A1X2HH34_SYNRA|nr:hypothetical protein BCR43DRAFT_264920 [Syncephalastrum racemosum]
MALPPFLQNSRAMSDRSNTPTAKYYGREQLFTYLHSTRSPTYDGFLGEYKDQMPSFSFSCFNSSASDLHRIWASRYATALRKVKPQATVPNIKMEKGFWQEVCTRIRAMQPDEHSQGSGSTSGRGSSRKRARRLDESSEQNSQRTSHDGELDNEDDGELDDEDDGELEYESNAKENDDERLTGIKSALFVMGCKKLIRKRWTDAELRLFNEIESNPLLDQDRLDLLKLSLSGIVNTVRDNDFKQVRPFLMMQRVDERLDAVKAEFRRRGATSRTKAQLEQVVERFAENGSVEDTLLLIHDLQRPFLVERQRRSQEFRALHAAATM